MKFVSRLAVAIAPFSHEVESRTEVSISSRGRESLMYAVLTHVGAKQRLIVCDRQRTAAQSGRCRLVFFSEEDVRN